MFLLKNGFFTKILFVDEMSVSTSARNGYGWTYNQRLVVDAPQNHVDRANYFGAVEVTEGTIIETVRKSAKASSFLQLLHKIEQHYPDDKMLIVMDNGAVHHSWKVGKFFNERDNMKIYLNGKLVEKQDAKVSVFDHGFLYGDGAFEGIRSYNGVVFRLKEHIERLYHLFRFFIR